MKLTHFNRRGAAHMVEVGAKAETARVAIASGRVEVAPATAKTIRASQRGTDRAVTPGRAGKIGKGDVLGIARLAGIQAAKRASDLIPLCHPLRLTGVDVDLRIAGTVVEIRATVRAFDRTGVEMEALAAVSVAALTVYDMCKAIDRGMKITQIQLEEKSGGKSGTWTRAGVRTRMRNSGRHPATSR